MRICKHLTGGHLYPNTTKWYRSALQSWLECTRWMEPLDLDIVVYVFCENDVSDQIRGRGTVIAGTMPGNRRFANRIMCGMMGS